jgi:hypothetical protein
MMLVEVPRMRKLFEGAYFYPGVVVEGARLHNVVVLDSWRL